jgi:hypothetical protein
LSFASQPESFLKTVAVLKTRSVYSNRNKTNRKEKLSWLPDGKGIGRDQNLILFQHMEIAVIPETGGIQAFDIKQSI